MGPKHYQASGGGDVATLVEEIEQTGDRLAAAVEALAFKKAHLKDEFIEIAEEKADQFLEKAEETKDQLVAKISDKIPDRRDSSVIVGRPPSSGLVAGGLVLLGEAVHEFGGGRCAVHAGDGDLRPFFRHEETGGDGQVRHRGPYRGRRRFARRPWR